VAKTARDTSLAIGIGNFLLGSLFGHSIWPQGHARYIIQGPVHWDVSIARLLWPQNPEPPLTNHRPSPPTRGSNLQNQLHREVVLAHRSAKYPGSSITPVEFNYSKSQLSN